MSEYLDKLKMDLRELRSKKEIAIIKVQGYLKILSRLLDVDCPDLADEVAEAWKDLKDAVGSVYLKDTLLWLLQREKDLWHEMKMAQTEEG